MSNFFIDKTKNSASAEGNDDDLAWLQREIAAISEHLSGLANGFGRNDLVKHIDIIARRGGRWLSGEVGDG